MRKIIALAGLLFVAGCGARDRCQAPQEIKPISVKDMSLVEKADALGVPPDQVPGEPRSATSYDTLMRAATDNARAQSAYESYIADKNAKLQRGYCLENEAYKARHMTDDMNTLAKAITATCQSSDDDAVLATILKYRNCAAGR